MKIRVYQIGKEGLELDIQVAETDIETSDLDEKLSAPVKFRGRLDRVNSGIIISGKFRGIWQVTCARCLVFFEYPVEDEFRIHLGADDPIPGEDSEGEDFDFSEFSGDEIDLEDILREQMILQLPMKLVCSENCKGLCPICGQNLNLEPCQCESSRIDPRFAKLKSLFKK